MILAVAGFVVQSREEHSQQTEQLIHEGRKLYEAGKLEQATMKLSEALQHDPERASVYMERGITYLSRRDYVRSLADFNEAIRRNPIFGEAYLLRSVCYEALGAQDKAAEDRERAASFGVRDVSH